MTELSSETISGPMIELHPGDNVVIGCATSDIAPGTMAHGHNVQFHGFEEPSFTIGRSRVCTTRSTYVFAVR
ncbi:FtsP/CotA-like multicopper oxidase with cupredoxin domain [Paraburkholderia sp. GAS33]